MKSQLLIHEEPLQVLPSLAVAVGLNEAIILQQVHYWLKRTEHEMEGTRWIYNSYVQWRSQFPFWGLNTIKRAIVQLESLGVLVSTARFNRNPIDKTKWYTINYTRLNDFYDTTTTQNGLSTTQDGSSSAHLGSMDDPSWVYGRPILGPLPETTSETTSEILKTKNARAKKIMVRYRPEYTPGFLSFWSRYPHERRASKPTCLQLWHDAALEERSAEIAEKVERLKVTSWRECQPTFIPMTLTWLREGRYDDELMEMPRAITSGLGAREQRTAQASLRLIEEMKHGRL